MSLLDDVRLAEQASRDLEIQIALPKPPRTRVMFYTERGALELHELRLDEVCNLNVSGKLTDDEVREWSQRNNKLGIRRAPMRRLRSRKEAK